MIRVLREWYQRYFTDPQVVILAFLLIVGFGVMMFLGRVIAPLLASIVIAYVLDGPVAWLNRHRAPNLVSVLGVFAVFVLVLTVVLGGLLPMMYKQVTQMVVEFPNMMAKGERLLMELPTHYPNFMSPDQARELVGTIRSEMAGFGQRVLSLSLASAVEIVTIMVYLVLVPLLVFFLLKDKQKIIRWASGFLPDNRSLVNQVWAEVNARIASYIRGKLLEILIVWGVTFITFRLFGLHYAMILSFIVGISVIVPYVGAALVTLPVAFIAYVQFGLSTELAYIMTAYGVIQFLDGNLLVPLLFSEVVNLHPIAIIAAVLVFGGLWGVWGVFFAIPLATLIQAVLNTWPKHHKAIPELSETGE